MIIWKKLFDLHKDLPFLPESKKVNKLEKLICSVEDKEKYVMHIRVLKQALNHGLVLRKIHRVIQFNQKDWLKPYIDMNAKLRKEAKNDFEKDLFKLRNNFIFEKTMENVRKYRDIKLVTTDEKRNKLVSEPNYHTTKRFLLAIETKKTKVKMNKPIYLGMPILDISKTLMYKFWYDYFKPKYWDGAKLCYTDTYNFIIHIMTEDFFEDISNDVEIWYDTCNYDENDERPLPIRKNKKLIGLFKDELAGKIVKEFWALRAKTYSYLMDGDCEVKKAKATKKCIIKQKIMFANYTDCLFNNKIILKSQQRFKVDHHKVYTKEVKNIPLSSNDDKRLQTFNVIETYPYGTNAFKVCESKMLTVKYLFLKNYNEI